MCNFKTHFTDWYHAHSLCYHYNNVILSGMASQVTSLTVVYSTVYPGAVLRKHQSSASLVFVRGIHRSPVNSPHKGPVTRKMFPSCFKWMSQDLTGDRPTNAEIGQLAYTWANFDEFNDAILSHDNNINQLCDFNLGISSWHHITKQSFSSGAITISNIWIYANTHIRVVVCALPR